MSSTAPAAAPASDMTIAEATTLESRKRPWWVTLIQGIAAMIIGGVLLFGGWQNKAEMYLLLVTLLGVWWLISGFMDIVHMFMDHKAWAWKLFMGIISIAAGGYILMYPVAAAVILPKAFVWVLGFWGVINGFVMLALAFKGAGWGVGILGVIEIGFGCVLIANAAVPGWGLSMVWTAAVFALVGGAVAIVRAIQEKTSA